MKLFQNSLAVTLAALLFSNLGCEELELLSPKDLKARISSYDLSKKGFLDEHPFVKEGFLLGDELSGPISFDTIVSLGPPPSAGEVALGGMTGDYRNRKHVWDDPNGALEHTAWDPERKRRPAVRGASNQMPLAAYAKPVAADLVRTDRARIHAMIDKDSFDAAPIPYSPVVAILTRFGDTWHSCAGTFVGPAQVMTAGHCVFDHVYQSWASEVIVIPANYWTSELGEFERVETFDVMDQWLDVADPEFDIAVLQTESEMGYETGWYGLASAAGLGLDGIDYVNVASLAPGGQSGVGIMEVSQPSDLAAAALRYTLTRGSVGLTGAPVWLENGAGDWIVGIHNGIDERDAAAVRIDGDIFEWVRSLIQGPGFPGPRLD